MPEHPLAAAAALAGVSDPCVLDAVASVPRADFVPPELAAEAEHDTPLWGLLVTPSVRSVTASVGRPVRLR